MALKKPTTKSINESPIILTTEKVAEILKKSNMGIPLKKNERLWFSNNTGIRRPGLTFAMTEEEIKEYAKCKLSVHYFAEKYCQIKREDGSIGPMTLRDYQKDIIDLYDKNRYSILMASRQVGKCNSFITNVEIKELNGNISTIPLGILYFNILKEMRKLSILESLKFFLYKLYFKIS